MRCRIALTPRAAANRCAPVPQRLDVASTASDHSSVRISCAECLSFVELPEQIEMLGRFVCASCRRRFAGAQAAEPAQRPASQPPARRRAGPRRSSRPPPAPYQHPPDVVHAPPAPRVPVFAEPSAPFASPAVGAEAPAPHLAPPAFGVAARPRTDEAFPFGTPAPSRPPPAAVSIEPGRVPMASHPSSPPPATIAAEPISDPFRTSRKRTTTIAALGAGAVVLVVLAVVGLGGGDEPAKEAAAAPSSAPAGPRPSTPAAATQPAAAAGTTPPATPAAPAGVFDRAAADQALNAIVEKSDSCKKPGDPAGVARIKVTFDPSGSVAHSEIERGALSSTSTGKCLAKLFDDVRVPPFKGEMISLTRAIVVR
jgi:hypothetical protein